MTKKFIKSAVILGLASITISMTQPVEAISNSLEYQQQYKRVKEELDALKATSPKLGERSLYFRLVNKFLSWFGQVWDPLAIKETDYLLDLIGQVNYLVSNTEFQAPEYKEAKNKLDLAVAGYDLYLAREKKRGDAPDYQVTQLTLEQIATIKTKIREALETFAQEVKTIQQKNPDLFPHAYVLNAKSKDITDKAQPFLVNGYYDVFYKQFLFTNKNDGYNYNKEADNLASYQKLIKELLDLKAEIDRLTTDKPDNDLLETLMWQSKFTLSDSRRTSRLSAYYTQEDYVDKVVLSEEAPNLRTAKEKVKTLKGILHDYYVETNDLEKAKKYHVEDETLPSQPRPLLNLKLLLLVLVKNQQKMRDRHKLRSQLTRQKRIPQRTHLRDLTIVKTQRQTVLLNLRHQTKAITKAKCLTKSLKRTRRTLLMSQPLHRTLLTPQPSHRTPQKCLRLVVRVAPLGTLKRKLLTLDLKSLIKARLKSPHPLAKTRPLISQTSL